LLWGAVAFRRGVGSAWLKGKREGLRGFRFYHRDSEVIEQVLDANEGIIRTLSRDRYWKLYFLLTRGAK
jgi:hypothetical protein